VGKGGGGGKRNERKLPKQKKQLKRPTHPGPGDHVVVEHVAGAGTRWQRGRPGRNCA
jgi:hypothetical protein